MIFLQQILRHFLPATCLMLFTLPLTAQDPCIVAGPDANVSICANQLPYVWNGNSYNAAGTYMASLESVAGCDSIVHLNLTVVAFFTSTTNIPICPAQLPYTWNGITYTAAGTYNVTLISTGGCDSVATLNLSVDTYASTTNVNICTAQLPYSWNGNNLTASGSYNVTLISLAGCDSVATLNLTVSSAVNSLTSVTVCTNMLPYFWNGNNYNAGGSYITTLISSSGCDSVATLDLRINNISVSQTQATVCGSQLPYVWNGSSYVVPGTYTITLTSISGCDSIATLELNVVYPAPGYNTVSVCPAQLPYVWNGNTYTTPGNYSVPFTTVNNCDSIANLCLRLQNNWTGNINSSWEEPGNWSCNTVPDAYTNVVIESGTPVLHSNTTINSIKLSPTANLTVDTGFTLNVQQVAPL